MVDLHAQYQQIKPEIDQAIQDVIANSAFIGGKFVGQFENELKAYLDLAHVVSCGNGTDALQLALMALELQSGDEVIVPGFTFVAPAEAVALLGLKPVFADVCADTFNITAGHIKPLIGPKTKAVIVVHLFGQMADMEPIMTLAEEYNLKVIEDVAQTFGAKVQFKGTEKMAGTIGDIGCTSFFPSKNLACFGDGGAVYTANEALAKRVKMIANHGQPQKYTHHLVGVNSRLDGLQAAILSVKLRQLDRYISSRRQAAKIYDENLKAISWLMPPIATANGGHTYNQYTIKLGQGIDREHLMAYLKEHGIPSMVYYHHTIDKQLAYQEFAKGRLNTVEVLCTQVLSLPMHTELSEEQQAYICSALKNYHG